MFQFSFQDETPRRPKYSPSRNREMNELKQHIAALEQRQHGAGSIQMKGDMGIYIRHVS